MDKPTEFDGSKNWTGTLHDPFIVVGPEGTETFCREPRDADEENLKLRILARCFADLYRGNNTTAHYIHGEDGTEKGWYRTEKRGIEPDDIWRHLRGEEPALLTVPILLTGNCHTAHGDIDTHGPDAAPVDHTKLARRITEFGLPVVLTGSRRDGGHLELYFKEVCGIPAPIARRLMAHYMKILGVKGEIFPKQDDKPEKMGSGINLPYFGAARSAYGEDGEILSLEDFLILASKRRAFGVILASRDLVTPDAQSSPLGREKEDRPLPLFVIRNLYQKKLQTLRDTNRLGHWNIEANNAVFWAGRAFAANALDATEKQIKGEIWKAADPYEGSDERALEATLKSGWSAGILQPLEILDPEQAEAEAQTQIMSWLNDKTELSIDDVLDYLALLDEETYYIGDLRDKCSKKLKVLKPKLDTFVAKRRPNRTASTAQSSNVVVEDTEVWETEVDGPAVMSEVARVFRRFVIFKNPTDAETVTLWTAGTHIHNVFNIYPRAGLFAVKHDCGKSTLLDVAGQFVCRVIRSDNITTSACFHLVQLYRPSLMIDELDSFLLENSELIGIMNSGHKAGGRATRMEKQGEKQVAVQYDTFCPIMFAMIAPPYPPGAFLSRTIQIKLEPKKLSDKAEDFNLEESPELAGELLMLRRKMARWSLDHAEHIRNSNPETGNLHNRNRTNWRALLKVADVLGGAWPGKILTAAGVPPVRSKDSDAMMLLEDIRSVYRSYVADKKPIDGIPATTLVNHLVYDHRESGWYRYRNGRDPLDEGNLKDLLKGFEIEPKSVRLNKTHRDNLGTDKLVIWGYRLAWFEPQFAKFLKPLELDVPEEVSGQIEFPGKG